tara:strand:+ start:1843 stop:2835 length:993 start_codon:yes stop_codon:yes gene_type:complete
MKFRFLFRIGRGVGGDVCIVEQPNTFEIYAVKKLKYDMNNVHAETNILKMCRHENIVSLMFIRSFQDHAYLFMCPMDCSLRQYLLHFVDIDLNCSLHIFKSLMSGLAYCHSLDIAHRDVKPENILMNSEGNVRICDFGLARQTLQYPCTPNVVTLWYRAPELLFGSQSYDFTIDTWAACCCLVEMMNGYPIFKIESLSEINQINKIADIIGKPTCHDMTLMRVDPAFAYVYEKDNKDNNKIVNKDINKTVCKTVCARWVRLPDSPEYEFVRQTLSYSVVTRPSATSILESIPAHIFQKTFNVKPISRVCHATVPADWSDVLMSIEEVFDL